MHKHLGLITLHDKHFETYFSAQQLDEAVDNVAHAIDIDYKNKTPLFLAVLNGAFMFASDLLKKIEIDCEIQFVKLKSYEGTSSSGEVKELIGIPEAINGRDIIVLEDIVDTGGTIVELYQTLKNHAPKSVKTASLLLKPDAYHGEIPIDYVGIEIPNEFVVGYGLDYDGLGRNLKDLYKIKN